MVNPPLPGADQGTRSVSESGGQLRARRSPPYTEDDLVWLEDVLAELRWIDEQLEEPPRIPSPNAAARRERLRRQQARLEALL